MWRNGDIDRNDDVEANGLAACLAEEATCERPVFSPGFHAAVMQRVRAEADRRPPRRLHAPPDAASCGGRPVPQPALRLAALAICGGVALMLASGFPPGQVWLGLPAGDRVESVSAALHRDRPLPLEVAAAEETSLIERLPLFDDIDREVRSGVVLVAASLLDLPAWRDVADFDPVGFLGVDSPP